MTPDVAAAKRKASIDDPTNIDKKYYRNPYLSDSASCYISVSFLDNATTAEKPLSQREYIELSTVSGLSDQNSENSDSPVSFDHFPERMYRVDPNIGESAAIRKALLLLYAKDEKEIDFIKNTLDIKCQRWADIDKANGEEVFNVDPKNKNRLIRNTSVDASIFKYDGCPCEHFPSLNHYTAAQVRRFVYREIPSCNITQMKKALSIYQEAARFLKNANDQAKIRSNIALLSNMITETNSIVAKEITRKGATIVNQRIADAEKNCPSSWVDLF
jgi:hypothetical protein